MQALRVAVAGCHRMVTRQVANHNWAAAFAGTGHTPIVAVYDPDGVTRAAFVATWGGDVTPYDDYEAMLAATRPDIVCVATRQSRHAEQVEAAAAAGVRGILCDKPLATSMGETARIVDACARHDIRFAFGLDRRWWPYHQGLVALVRDGAIGAVQTITMFGLNAPVFHGCHWFDRALELAGDPEIAWVSGRLAPLEGEPPDSRKRLDPAGSCHIQLANGSEVFVTSASYSAGFDMSFDVVGSGGRLVVVSEGADTCLWVRGPDGMTPLRRALPPVPPPVPWPLVVEDLVAAIRDRRPTRCDIACARRATLPAFAMHQSHREGERRIAPNEVDPALCVASLPWGT